MKKIIKKSLSLTLALIMLVGIIASTNVFAEGTFEKKVVSDLTAKIEWINSKVTGNVKFDNIFPKELSNLEEKNPDEYVGKLETSVEAGDLFDGAYKLYKEKLYERRGPKGYWRNAVMFGETRDTFPNATYTVNFPENIFVDKENIKAISNSSTISKIDVSPEDHSVKFTFYLGTWNDYEGFFNLVEKELDSPNHTIDISIPFTVKANENTSKVLGTVKGNGECKLYKFGILSPKGPIIDITSPEVKCEILNPINKGGII